MSKKMSTLLAMLTIVSSLISSAVSVRMFATREVIAEESTQNKAITADRSTCSLCSGKGLIVCPRCQILGRKDNCPSCKGTNLIKCPVCRGTGKAIVLSDIIPKNKQNRCGIHKLTPSEQYALLLEMHTILNDRWDNAAGKYLDREGWVKATVIRKSGDLILVKTEYGRELILDDIVPSYGIFVGSKIWLESTFGMINIIDEDGDTGSYMVR